VARRDGPGVTGFVPEGVASSFRSTRPVRRDGSSGPIGLQLATPVTAPWLGLSLPVALAEPPEATLEVRQTNLKPMDEGVRYEYQYKWTVRGRGTPPKEVGVDVIGAKDIRVIDMKAQGTMQGTFAVTTTKATDPGRYDLYINGRLRLEDGETESIVSRPIPFEVTNGDK